jgi:hypothetical protein
MTCIIHMTYLQAYTLAIFIFLSFQLYRIVRADRNLSQLEQKLRAAIQGILEQNHKTVQSLNDSTEKRLIMCSK